MPYNPRFYANFNPRYEFEHNGMEFIAQIRHDEDQTPPWDQCDGHGVVTDWTRRDKKPGERVLCEDRGSKRFYDFAASVKQAITEQWGAPTGYFRDGATPTRRQIAVAAVEHDFAYLRAWCNDNWHYIWIRVWRAGADESTATSLSGVEGFGDYWKTVCTELAEEWIAENPPPPTINIITYRMWGADDDSLIVGVDTDEEMYRRITGENDGAPMGDEKGMWFTTGGTTISNGQEFVAGDGKRYRISIEEVK